MSRVKNTKTVPSYWDEGNIKLFEWYRKGKWKRINRKRWIKKRLKDLDKE